ncbi:MAG: Glyoxylate reductase [uncultured bacterium]|uniref:D-glycerate dehydrogenase n=1 Tax=Candidatus Woesebacteria bacterium RIFCSPHIGHO2_12_FULL_41_24 TaxID=1802510 RepID=A0A1F8ATG8_9BACT|nr:MAG: Glyoxylate reductase [uncultured bacterium]OGM14585.1 MAG: D-glycerate dehydrogenase [Candidatus Woesebacteria bacterium RBG_16_41_13]OGM30411.1 MAG: D-glycerate dehydrogenase [Candidatus Woesebacteria bacterium RIFCSPHIGHO2_01_FULL_42_80]OGM35457.1 MAG: D-glycerate dehydrogenase [Candidatus Woesebacteria bacterium RIFCSPHIGHO2_02_FULL_42_20]OGM55032.1 MAG: D-glycerate dehydrogenase [Candidatus Woesebacteria bacterium RIFCSPHIGHO2_12_FULL_41_24]OGM66378.1 MAG: D-glycerate dehydrogenase
MAKIFVTRKIPGSALDKLKGSGNEVVVSEFDRPLTSEELLESARGFDALLCLLTDRIDGEVLDALGPQLKIVSNYAVGFDNIKVEEATERGVLVTNTPSEVINESVSEFAWTLMLALAKRVVEADESTRRGAYKGWEPSTFLGVNMVGKTLGILGMGRIGGLTARRALGWNMKVLYYKRSRDEAAEKELEVEYADLDRLYQESDFISVHVPLTDETRHMINKIAFDKMKKGVIVVNTARGPIIDEGDLVRAIREGKVGGAGLDVFDNEPNINPELINMENVILTPHIASATNEAREEYGNLAVNAILDALTGKKPQNLVNEEVWERRKK